MTSQERRRYYRAKRSLERALDLFGPNGEHWGKDHLRAEDEHGYYYCSMGALRASCQAFEIRAIACEALVLALRGKRPLEPGKPVSAPVVYFNDDEATDWPQIEQMFRDAIKILEEEEARTT